MDWTYVILYNKLVKIILLLAFAENGFKTIQNVSC